MQEKGGAKYGINLSTNNWQECLPFVWQNGGDLAEGDEFTLDSPEAVEATDFYKSFFDEGLTPPSTPAGLRHHARVRARHAPDVLLRPVAHGPASTRPAARASRRSGRSRRCRRRTADTSFVGGSDLVVFKNAENRDAAWKFVEYLLQARDAGRSGTRP